ncbi:hypothetical protein, conserved [Eimeria brunetti]|uniref:Uncharacterized protein n=1 Tax=Eimeria brunetti TaxID=51314 RepID=U6LQC8_9EIME|nr:hypothetical protein, conserved [Eimeria brunetti]
MLGVATRSIGLCPSAAAAAAAGKAAMHLGGGACRTVVTAGAASPTAAAAATATSSAAGASRQFSGVKFLDQKRTGEETVYFKKEDEALLRRLLAKHPEADPKFQSGPAGAPGASRAGGGPGGPLGALHSSLALCLAKHFQRQPPKALIEELPVLFASHGWEPPAELKELVRGLQERSKGPAS